MTEDHWLKLGDLGFYDEEGFLSVLGKESNFITLSTGEVISPLRVSIRVRNFFTCEILEIFKYLAHNRSHIIITNVTQICG